MSFWTELRDDVTAPFRAVGSLAEDIYHGDYSGGLGRFVSREASWFAGGFAAPVIDSDVVQGALNNKIVNSLTFGVSGDLANLGKVSDKINSGDNFGWTDVRSGLGSALDGSAKVTAAILTAGTAGAVAEGADAGEAGIAVAEAGGAYTGAQGAKSVSTAVSSGDWGSALQAASTLSTGAGVDVPTLPGDLGNDLQGISQAAKDAQNAFDLAKGALGDAQNSANQAAGLVALAKANTPAVVTGYSSNTNAALPASNTLLYLGGVALIAILVLRRK